MITLLGGRVHMARAAEGLAPTTDAVLLAAAVPASDGDRVLDVGAGSGAASLCLAVRAPGCRVVGLERDADLVAAAEGNARASGVADRVNFVVGTVGGEEPTLAPFDHVLTNPPYLTRARAHRRTGAARAAATVEGPCDLATWIRFCLAALRPRGTLAVIHRADRLADVLAAIDGPAGGIVVLPIRPRPGADAIRVLVLARKGARTPLRIAPGLVLHGDGSTYTAAAEAILRGGAGLRP